jgi:hypothetical protein
LFTASALAQTGFRQGKSPTDAAGACAALSNQDTTKPAAALARAEINVEEKGDEFLIRAQSEVEADGAAIWSTLSDYDHLAGFIPGMSSSRTVSRTGAEAVVEQKGSAGLGPFRQPFTVLLAVREEMNQSISRPPSAGTSDASSHATRSWPWARSARASSIKRRLFLGCPSLPSLDY